ncbi:MAG: hypothetical protein J6S60_00200 [Oscillospiraceae bacterium]|nr:hypothetical protein [Oscillospiraceae bacterium]
MAEYIEREAALEVAIGWREQLLPNYGENDEYVKCLETVAEHLYDIPSADVRPVVHAHYIINEDGDPRCSACGAKYIDSTKRYCPDCGARMDGVDMREV